MSRGKEQKDKECRVCKKKYKGAPRSLYCSPKCKERSPTQCNKRLSSIARAKLVKGFTKCFFCNSKKKLRFSLYENSAKTLEIDLNKNIKELCEHPVEDLYKAVLLYDRMICKKCLIKLK